MAVMTLSDKLDQLGTRYDELTRELSTAEIVSDSSRFQKVAKQHAELEQIVAKHREYKQIEKDFAGAHQMFLEAEDSEMKQLAHDEEKQLDKAAAQAVVEAAKTQVALSVTDLVAGHIAQPDSDQILADAQNAVEDLFAGTVA